MRAARTKAAIIRLIYNYVAIVLMIIQGILLVPVYLQFINPRLYGAWIAIGSVLSALTLMDLGFSAVLSQQIAVAYGKKDLERIGNLAKTGLLACTILSTLPFTISLVVSYFAPEILHITDCIQLSTLTLSCIIAGASTSTMMLVYSTAAVIHGLQKEAVLSIISICTWVTGILATILMLYKNYGLLSIPCGFLLRAMLNSLCNAVYLFHLLRNKLNINVFFFKKEIFKSLFNRSILVFSGKFSKNIALHLDTFFIAVFIAPEFATIFALTKKPAEMVSLFSVRIIEVLVPGIAHLSGEGDQVKLRKITVNVLKVSLIFAIVAVGGVYLLNESFFELWVGLEFYGGNFLTGLICISTFLMICSLLFYNTLIGYGMIEVAGWSSTLEGLIRVPLSAALCYLCGLHGVVLAAIISVLPTGIYVQLGRLINKTGISFMKNLPALIVAFVECITPFLFMLFFKQFWTPSGSFEFFVFSLCYLILSCILLGISNKDLRRIQKSFYKKAVNRIFKCTQTL